MTNDSDISSSKNNEISIIELWDVLFQSRLKIILITFLFGIGSIIYALTATVLWKPEVIIYASDDSTNNEGSSINTTLSQFIAPAAQDSKTSKYLAILIDHLLSNFTRSVKILSIIYFVLPYGLEGFVEFFS